MINHSSITPPQLRKLIRSGKVAIAGNQHLKIYGTLNCSSGKKMKRENRIFFTDEVEAILAGYRPCGHCLRKRYLAWEGK